MYDSSENLNHPHGNRLLGGVSLFFPPSICSPWRARQTSLRWNAPIAVETGRSSLSLRVPSIADPRCTRPTHTHGGLT